MYIIICNTENLDTKVCKCPLIMVAVKCTIVHTHYEILQSKTRENIYTLVGKDHFNTFESKCNCKIKSTPFMLWMFTCLSPVPDSWNWENF